MNSIAAALALPTVVALSPAEEFASCLSTLNPPDWALLILAALLLGITKAGVSGLGTISILIMADIFGPKASSGIILPMLICGDIMAVSYYNRHANWKLLPRLLPAAVVGIIIGYQLMTKINDAQLQIIIGVAVLILILITILRDRGIIPDDKFPKSPLFAVGVGIFAGVITMMMNAAGPLMMVYFMSMKLEKNQFIGTGAWFFLVVNCLKVPLQIRLGGINSASLLFNLKLMPVILVGGLLGIWIVKRLSNKRYQIWVRIIASVGALRMFGKGLAGLIH